MRVTLVIDEGSMRSRERKFEEAQGYIDSECLRLMEPYVPVALPFYHNAGRLRDSGRIAEPGLIEYTAPKAEEDYYNDKVDHRNGGNPNAQRLWFEVMKRRHIEEIAKGVEKITGGKAII